MRRWWSIRTARRAGTSPGPWTRFGGRGWLTVGRFIGGLGSTNCFVVMPKNREKLKVPSDLEGYSVISYDDERFAESPEAAVIPVVTNILGAIRQTGEPSPKGESGSDDGAVPKA